MTLHELWYKRNAFAYLLSPLTVLFAFFSALRRLCFRVGIFQTSKPDAVVIIVGNISVGGNGKTPVVLAIIDYLKHKGVSAGVLSRGYGGSHQSFPHQVNAENTAAEVGDEPFLIANRTAVPVVIDPKRARGAAYLADDLGCQVIVCDDGLQHYALQRDVELVVMDARGVGNGNLLPMGPLREGIWRLHTVDGIVANGDVAFDSLSGNKLNTPLFPMSLIGEELVNVVDSSKRMLVVEVRQTATAIAGIGHPERFFQALKGKGLTLNQTFGFNDHHDFSPADIPSGMVIMTEKDAVKVKPFAHDECWYLPVCARLPKGFYDLIDAACNAASDKE